MKTDNMKDVYAFIAEVKSNARGNYQLTDSSTIADKSFGTMYFVLSDGNEKNDIVIRFIKFNEGGNKTLEIAGKRMYRFAQLTGLYLDIFPMWKKFVDPNADQEALTKKPSVGRKLDEDGTERLATFTIDKNASIWVR
jgi:hypothetical protein